MFRTSCGEKQRHATYLINRLATRTLVLQTPYESFKGKKPNVEHIRVFGCVGYVKIDSAHLRKLDDRSRDLVHLGTEPGTKAYRLVNLMTKSIVVSRDVVFDETQKGRWLETSENGKDESDMIDFGFKSMSDQETSGDKTGIDVKIERK